MDSLLGLGSGHVTQLTRSRTTNCIKSGCSDLGTSNRASLIWGWMNHQTVEYNTSDKTYISVIFCEKNEQSLISSLSLKLFFHPRVVLRRTASLTNVSTLKTTHTELLPAFSRSWNSIHPTLIRFTVVVFFSQSFLVIMVTSQTNAHNTEDVPSSEQRRIHSRSNKNLSFVTTSWASENWTNVTKRRIQAGERINPSFSTFLEDPTLVKLPSKPLTLDLMETSEGLAIIKTRPTEKWRE
jgi:hypothetical protein